jgi:hypothetical protein
MINFKLGLIEIALKAMGTLTTEQINSFIDNGFVRIENAFSTEIADTCRAILWKANRCDPNNPETWTQPVIRIGSTSKYNF